MLLSKIVPGLEGQCSAEYVGGKIKELLKEDAKTHPVDWLTSRCLRMIAYNP